jgi:hypothetical protein
MALAMSFQGAARTVLSFGLGVGLAVGLGCRGASAPRMPSTPPTASFTYTPGTPTVDTSVQFSDTSTGSPTSWSWIFGDGGTSSAQNPSHLYSESGTYAVTLTARNATGSTTSTRAVAVAAAPLTVPGIVLGRPTDVSIVASVSVAADAEVYLEYGTAPGIYTVQTVPQSGSRSGPIIIQVSGLTADMRYYYRARYQTVPQSGSRSGPIIIQVSGLTADMRYYYRARYRARTESIYAADTEHSFHTWRRPGGPFTFVVQADPHLDVNSSTAVYSRTLANELADQPDFMVDLGDTSMVEKCAVDGATLCAAPSPASAATVWARYSLVRSYFDLTCHSVPLFMVLGNHDGEAGWPSNPAELDTWAITTRKTFLANPEPDGFYSGNGEQTPGIGLRENYYAFEWGDALFVMLDPYTYTTPKPTADGWGWTLGATQYQWLARTLSASRARFKFVFSHHLVGGNGKDARGGAAFAQFFEWGGRNADGTWGFDVQRPGWGVPIHQLLVNNRVTAWFHGHDHFYAQEQLDGIVYQEVPQPSQSRYENSDPGAGYGYLGSVGVNQFPSSGHLGVTVEAGQVRVEYVRSVAPADETDTRKNGSIVTSYVVR